MAELHHPAWPGWVLTHASEPWSYLEYLLQDIPNDWPTTGWRLRVDGLTCPNPQCLETNLPNRKAMVEQERDGTIFCNRCGQIHRPSGKAATTAKTAT